jgi:hypothetical protein
MADEDQNNQISLQNYLGTNLLIKREGKTATASTSSVVDGKYIGEGYILRCLSLSRSSPYWYQTICL